MKETVRDQICADGLQLTIACSSDEHTSAATTASAWACTWGGGACWQGGRLAEEPGLHLACGRKSRSLSQMCHTGSVLKDCATSSYRLGAVLERLRHRDHKPLTCSALLLSAWFNPTQTTNKTTVSNQRLSRRLNQNWFKPLKKVWFTAGLIDWITLDYKAQMEL